MKINTHSKKKLKTLLESVREDKWLVLKKNIGDLFRVYNPAKGMTVHCKKIRKAGDWEYWCYINQGIKTKYLDDDSARDWANKIMKKIGGQQIIKIEKRISNEIQDADFNEISELISSIKKFMKTWGIGVKAKSFDEENEEKRYRKVIQKAIETGETSTGEIEKSLKDETQKYKDGKPNIPTWKITRVARTEASALRTINKLLKFKKQGFEFVKHVTNLSKTTGQMDRDFNGAVFKIDWLLQNEKYRVPLHPNCRCNYVLSRGPERMSRARKWIK